MENKYYKKPIRETILLLKIGGEPAIFEYARMQSVRSSAYMSQRIDRRRYKVSQNKLAGTVSVFRIA